MTTPKTPAPQPKPAEIIERLDIYKVRLVREAVSALALFEVWDGLNEDTTRRRAVKASPVHKAIDVMWRATMDTLILTLVRSLEGFRGSVHATHKVSFQVVRKLLDEPGVLDLLVDRAKHNAGPAPARAKGQAVLEAAARLRSNVDRLASESPSRIRRLQEIRHRYLAHQLHVTDPLDPPEYESIGEIANEVLSLAEHTTRILEPTAIEWPRGELAAATARLIKVIAERFPTAAHVSGD
ncbi:hypothetical protein [Labrys monachus]|uniref:HEPN AbiU2-like domain-containing protein n=1 Tax=Labrys monachus TaxID=217067 RepID=A0ABU0FDJ4_9HYPH|nr:hypothetical protein [Labrys monachus]MDQ0392234.1 hypothetical protein [Labrys monachus]